MSMMLVPIAWTHFWDMHSGGGQKLEWPHIFIEAPEDAAIRAFERLFGRDPAHVTCDCCGPDYVIDTYLTLREASRYVRMASYRDDNVDERDTVHDAIVLRIARENLRLLTTTQQALVRMAGQTKQSPAEAATAIEMLVASGSMKYSLWRGQRFVPIEEFFSTGIGSKGEQCRIVRLDEAYPNAITAKGG